MEVLVIQEIFLNGNVEQTYITILKKILD